MNNTDLNSAPVLVPSNPLAAFDAERAARRQATLPPRREGFWRLVVAINDGCGPKDLATLEAKLAELNVTYGDLKHCVELLRFQRDARRRADLGPVDTSAKEARDLVDAAEDRHSRATAELAAAERDRTLAAEAQRRVALMREDAAAAGREAETLELQLAGRHCPLFAGLRERLAQEAAERERVQLRAHEQQLTDDEARREAERRYALRASREIMAPGTWTDRGFDAAIAEPEGSASAVAEPEGSASAVAEPEAEGSSDNLEVSDAGNGQEQPACVPSTVVEPETSELDARVRERREAAAAERFARDSGIAIDDGGADE